MSCQRLHKPVDECDSRRKDTWHRERLSKGVEGGAPRDLPWGDICEDKPQLQHQFVHLEQDTSTVHKLTSHITCMDHGYLCEITDQFKFKSEEVHTQGSENKFLGD